MLYLPCKNYLRVFSSYATRVLAMHLQLTDQSFKCQNMEKKKTKKKNTLTLAQAPKHKWQEEHKHLVLDLESLTFLMLLGNLFKI